MKKKISSIKALLIPSWKFNLFVLILLVLGVTCGAIYYNLLSKSDLDSVFSTMNAFTTSIKNNSYNYVQALLHSLGNNLFYIAIIFILGLSMIGIPFIIMLIFLKGLTVGFTVSTLIGLYKYKGSLYSFIYIFPKEILSFISYIIIGYYSINFSILIFKQIFKKEKISIRKELEKYLVVLGITSFIGIITSLLDAYLYPNLFNLLLNLLK